MKSNRFWIVVFCGIVLCSLLAMFFPEGVAGRGSGYVAHVYSGGALVESVDLAAGVERPYTMEIVSGGGRNVIEVGNGCIRMLEADCSNGVCVRQGWVTGGRTLIVCLPNNVVVEVEGGSRDIDGVVG